MTHGMSYTRPYKIWRKMLERCNDPKNNRYRYYGGKGITVCDEWGTFEGFWRDMEAGYQDGLTIDRINVNGNYEKQNCRWVTLQQQNMNYSKNRIYTYEGETGPLKYFVDKYNKIYYQVHGRLKMGWSIEDALLKPIKQLKPRAR